VQLLSRHRNSASGPGLDGPHHHYHRIICCSSPEFRSTHSSSCGGAWALLPWLAKAAVAADLSGCGVHRRANVDHELRQQPTTIQHVDVDHNGNIGFDSANHDIHADSELRRRRANRPKVIRIERTPAIAKPFNACKLPFKGPFPRSLHLGWVDEGWQLL